MKPETKLLTNIATITKLESELAGDGLFNERLSQAIRQAAKEARPRERNFEKRVAQLVAARLAARRAKNWAESDRIRDALMQMGVVLHDNKDGSTTWEVKR